MRRNAGFTLLELLMGAAIAAVLLAALYAVLHGVLGLRNRSYASIGEGRPEAAAAAVLKRDLAGMVVPVGLLSGTVYGEEQTEGGRRQDTLEFCTTTGKVGDENAYPSVQKVQYYVGDLEEEIGVAGTYLIRAVTRNLLATNAEDTYEAKILLSDVESLEIQYYDGEVWTTSWDSTSAETVLPKAVWVQVTRSTAANGEEADKDNEDAASLEVICAIPSESAESATDAEAAPAE